MTLSYPNIPFYRPIHLAKLCLHFKKAKWMEKEDSAKLEELEVVKPLQG